MKTYKIYNFIIPIFIFFGLVSGGISQSVTIKKIDPSGYPKVKAEFVVKNAKNEDVRTPDFGNVVLKENGKDKNGTVFCVDAGKTKFSLIVTIDISNSMKEIVPNTNGQRRIDIVKKVAQAAINALPDSNRWECAITTFDLNAEVNQGFTNSKSLLREAIGNDSVNPRGGTDYNSGFLYDTRVPARPGALLVARDAKYKPVVIFLTDGKHEGPNWTVPSRSIVWEKAIIDEAKDISLKKSQTPATIFAISVGLAMPQELKSIVSGADPLGSWYESTNMTEDDLRIIFDQILEKAGTIGFVPPCEVSWLTDCNGGGDVSLTLPAMGNIEATSTYVIPDEVKPNLKITPNRFTYPNTLPSTAVEMDVILTAEKNNVLISGVSSLNAKYSVSNWGGTPPPFTITKGQTRTIKVKYLTPDSNFTDTQIKFLSDACTCDTIFSHAGWIFAKPFNCGSQKISETKDVQKATFCNNTGDPVYIKSIQIKGGNKSDFVLVSPTGDITVPNDSCITLFIKFTPSALGLRSSTYEVEDGNGKIFTAVVDGTGSGNPEITALDKVNLPNASCKAQIQNIDIEINNSGARNLVITDGPITGTNAADFSLVPNVAGMTLLPGEKKPVTVKFEPKGLAGTKTATLTINSNAGTSPSFAIALTGKKDSIGYIVSTKTVNFGIVCPNEDKTMPVQLTSTGDIAFSVNANETAPFTLPVKTWNLANNQPMNVDIHIKSATEGKFTQNITFTDECNNQFIVEATGTVEQPKINKVKVDLKTTVGMPKDTTIRLCNTTARPIQISTATINASSFTIISPNAPPPDWTIPANDCIDIKVRFSPQTATIVNSSITLTGSPCSFKDSIELYGNPALATADLVMDDASGYVGIPVQIPVNLRNPFKVTESGATTFNTVLNYDSEVLKFVSINPSVTVVDNPGALSITGAPLSGTAGIMATVTFQPLATSKTTSELRLSGSKSVGGSVVFKEIPGIFTLKSATATIKIGDASGSPGQKVEMPIYLLNVNNITSFNVGINTELNFDATLLEPTDNNFTDLGISNGMRTIKYSNLSITPDANNIIHRAGFKAMLGKAKSTQVRVANTSVTTGKAIFEETPGNFDLKEVCESGGIRLFSPTGLAGLLQITPNPTGGNITITYETIESGTTRLWLSDILGINALELFNGSSSQGVHETQVDLSKLSSGRYIVILQTPTAKFSKWIDISK